MLRASSKKWRRPNTEIDIVLVEDGSRAGDYLVSTQTVERLPGFYERVKALPYKPGPAAQLADQPKSFRKKPFGCPSKYRRSTSVSTKGWMDSSNSFTCVREPRFFTILMQFRYD